MTATKNIPDLDPLTTLNQNDLFEVRYSSTSYRASLQQILGYGGLQPGGRLTLNRGEPVMQSDASGVGTIYYDSYRTNFLPVNGSLYRIPNNEISLVLDRTNHVGGSIYDIFAIISANAPILVRGPAWTRTTRRGTGTGTTQLGWSYGLRSNANILTHAYNNRTDYGPIAVGAAVYLGRFYATANGQTRMVLRPTAAAGGTNNAIAVYNGWNRELLAAICQDSNGDWTYTTPTWRPADGDASNTNMRINFLDGLGLSSFTAISQVSATNGTGEPACGVVVDSITAAPRVCGVGSPTTNSINLRSEEPFPPLLGWHYVQQMEWSVTGGTTTWFGSASGFAGSNLTGLIIRIDL